MNQRFSKSSNTTEQEFISGTVERITFHSEETGFCVLRIKVKGYRELLTVVGSTAVISAGEYLECKGYWVNDRKHGLQLKASYIKTVPPTTLEGIEKYLGSGMIRGIGPHFAKKLVHAFGEDVFDIIENTPEKLKELDGIGPKRTAKVIDAWDEQKAVREIMVFLRSHGVGTARSVRIYKTYGDNAVGIISKNPYQLAIDIHGLGFKTADTIAMKLGIKPDSLIRARAGVRHVLMEICTEGHCADTYDHLVETSSELLEIPIETIKDAILCELKNKSIVEDIIKDKKCIYLSSLYYSEVSVSENITRLNKGTPSWGTIDGAKAIPWVEQKADIKLSTSQQKAVDNSINNKVSIITGGPGVGKTTVVNSILKIVKAKKAEVVLCAPTGRAAKRLSETTNLQAKTIHRLLAFDPKTALFKHNRENPIKADFFVVDEASMIDITLMNSFLKAIPDYASLLIVGDVDQLPSVGPGSVLRDIINSKVVHASFLSEIFRQASDSMIIVNAHRINNGSMPYFDKMKNDFVIIYKDEVEDIFNNLMNIVVNRIPRRYNCDPIKDIQVLSPMNRGGLGCRALNIELQKALNGSSVPRISKYGFEFAPKDKVIQTINNYDKNVFNGDIGNIDKIDEQEELVYIDFDGRIVEYQFHELDEVSLAYATTIHKSQGSEYPIIVMPIATQHFTLLLRNLLYTGVTRGKKLVVLIGQKKAVGMAVHNNKMLQRITKLSDRLKENSGIELNEIN
ncbi:MAG TPA: ATP-dependent RecD-like DNA helicase [Victivallales bacterium]|nr:ATP-dependent RecD-like DNA helicase [Victivallales bacterium]